MPHGKISMPEVIGVVVSAAPFSWILLINLNFRPRKHRQNVVARSDTRALFPQFGRILPIGKPKTGVCFAFDDFKRLGTEACYRRARVGNPGIPEKPKAHFLGGFGGERPKDFRPLGYDGNACLVGQCHIAERGCLNACLCVVGELKDGSECKVGAGANESPKRQIQFYPLRQFDGKMKTKDWSKLPTFPVPKEETRPEYSTKQPPWVDPATFFDQLTIVM
jgi:hypothetical protein